MQKPHPPSPMQFSRHTRYTHAKFLHRHLAIKIPWLRIFSAIVKNAKMNSDPFHRDNQNRNDGPAKPPFLTQHCRHHNLSEMAIVFGIGIILAGLILTTLAAIIHFTLSPSPIVGYSCAAVWFAFTLWLWISLVLIGKTDRASRVSDRELYTLQALVFINITAHALFAAPHERATWHQLSLVFEWSIIAFHLLYFLLALCIWVRVPWKVYIGFTIMLIAAMYQTMH